MTSLAIIGSGVAGLMAAVQAAAAGAHPVLLTKDGLGDSNSELAQGGLSAVTSQSIAAGDSVAAHVADTLTAGAGHCGRAPVQFMCAGAQDLVDLLVEHAAGFDLADDGGFQLGLEAAHSAHRILHINGDATGAGLVHALRASVRSLAERGELSIVERALATDLELDEFGRVSAVNYLLAGNAERLGADAVLLATGGIGQIFSATTNPAGATADGLGLAARAGAVIADAEFVQFHPTLVDPVRYPSAGMVSEAVRGEGAVLVTEDGERFMRRVHPDAELAPRDVVARGIHQQLLAGRTVYLDARAVDAERGSGFLARRFPSITAALAGSGLDLVADLIPVVPAQHYFMGGIFTDDRGRTSVPGLYAAGECANTTVHGANRLASNSLLEAMVFARSAVDAALSDDVQTRAQIGGLRLAQLPPADAQAPLDLAGLQHSASAAIGVYRTGAALQEFAELLSRSAPMASTRRAQQELGNLWTAARFITQAALHRSASLGAHHRLDSEGIPAPGVRFGWTLPEREQLQPTILSKEQHV
ncbi:FAD-binding protein [Glutamicibacter sp.]|uniref:L-aspartate oxidase n=1 Tax=Glutamicibacter sp. TaxID=1931995 RepID=UPI0028BD4859|nr:FAD-binding protein [Glutamicibacter sp.]